MDSKNTPQQFVQDALAAEREQWTGQSGLVTPNLRRLFDLPRGSRFRYVDHPNKTFVLLSFEDSGIVGDAPSNDGNRRPQGFYAAAESRAEFEALMVEFVPVVEAGQRDELLAALNAAHHALAEVYHAQTNPNWFTHGQKGARKHEVHWLRKGIDQASEAIAKAKAAGGASHG